MAANIVGDLFTVDGGQIPPLRKTILSHAKKLDW